MKPLKKAQKAALKAQHEQQVRDAAQAAAAKLALEVGFLANGPGKTYEAWVMLEVANYLDEDGMKVKARSHADHPVTTFNFRGGPGGIQAPKGKVGKRPSFFRFELEGRRFELHNSLEHAGIGGGLHEIDFGILSDAQARLARWQAQDTGKVANPAGPPVYGMELKDYPHSHLSKNFARALLGMAVGLNPGFVFAQHVLVTPGGHVLGREVNGLEGYALVSSGVVLAEARQLLKPFGIPAASQVTPADPSDLKIILALACAKMKDWPS